MPNTTFHKYTALFSLPVCALLLILTFAPAYYVAAESMHECHEEDCPVCAALEVCEAVLNRMGSAAPVMAIATIIYFTYASAEKLSKALVPEHSLVEEKIRMNN